ncbi:MAG: hypothetical protein ACREUW_18775 [Burkholderiales bacterium]
MGAIFLAGPLVLVAGLIATIVGYVAWRRAPEPKRQPSSGLYWLGVVLVGGLAFLGGAAAGIWAACSAARVGNLCGLVGVFGFGPLLAGLALAAYAWWWSGTARRAP